MILQPVRTGGSGGAADLSRLQFGVTLLGVRDGINTTFTTPDKFVRTPSHETVYRNGVGLEFGAAADYILAESGGPGTGYDTVIFAVPPLEWEKPAISYLKKP